MRFLATVWARRRGASMSAAAQGLFREEEIGRGTRVACAQVHGALGRRGWCERDAHVLGALAPGVAAL